MRRFTNLLVGVLCMPLFLFGQNAEKNDYRLAELTYIKVKVGMEKKFVEAVKVHNEEYHSESPHQAGLYYITTGQEAGWFIWAMGGFTFTELDDAPGEGAHMDDWRKTIAPYVAEYGRTEYWRFAKELSVTNDISEPLETIWFMDIKRGEYYRFKAFMEKVKLIHEKMGDEIHLWTNEFHQPDGRDVAVVWPMENWAELDKEDWKIREEYNNEYGEGAWDNALEEWEDIIVELSQEVWRSVR
ncbi:MAG: hypothetical protein U5L96_03590 [Owenweeksia sp.]|nr:hypothetical protein [Owenweeksia sp.]